MSDMTPEVSETLSEAEPIREHPVMACLREAVRQVSAHLTELMRERDALRERIAELEEELADARLRDVNA